MCTNSTTGPIKYFQELNGRGKVILKKGCCIKNEEYLIIPNYESSERIWKRDDLFGQSNASKSIIDPVKEKNKSSIRFHFDKII